MSSPHSKPWWATAAAQRVMAFLQVLRHGRSMVSVEMPGVHRGRYSEQRKMRRLSEQPISMKGHQGCRAQYTCNQKVK